MRTCELPIHTWKLTIRTRGLPIRTRGLPIRTRGLPIRTRELPVRTRKLPIRTREMAIRTRKLPIRNVRLTRYYCFTAAQAPGESCGFSSRVRLCHSGSVAAAVQRLIAPADDVRPRTRELFAQRRRNLARARYRLRLPRHVRELFGRGDVFLDQLGHRIGRDPFSFEARNALQQIARLDRQPLRESFRRDRIVRHADGDACGKRIEDQVRRLRERLRA